MMYSVEQQIHNQIIHSHQIAYLLISKELKILAHNETVYRFTPQRGVLEGLPVIEIFPELFRLEDEALKQNSQLILHKLHRTVEHHERFFDLRIEPSDIQKGTLLVTMQDVTHEAVLEQRLVQHRNDLRLGIINVYQIERLLWQSARVNPRQLPGILVRQLAQLVKVPACFLLKLKPDGFDVMNAHAPWQMAEITPQQLGQICANIEQHLAQSLTAQFRIELPVIQEQKIRYVGMTAFALFLGEDRTKLVVLLDDRLERVFAAEEATFVQLMVRYAAVLITNNRFI